MSKMTPFDELSVKLDNEEELFYRYKKGGSNPLILLHGNISSSQNWDVLMNTLSTEFSIYALDMRGFGDSTYNNPIESLKDLSEDLKAFADKLKLKDFYLCGWSLGGNVAMRFTADHPGYVKKLLLLSSGPHKGMPLPKRILGLIKTKQYLSTKEDIAKSLKVLEKIRTKQKRSLLKTILNKKVYTHKKPNMARFVKYENAFMKQQNLVDVTYALSYANMSHEHNGLTEGDGTIDNINVETMIVHGAEDKVVNVEEAKALKDAIGDNAEIKVFDNAGHALVIDELDKLSDLFFELFIET